MAVPLPATLPRDLSSQELQDAILLAKDFVLMNGGLMRTSSSPNSSDVVSYVPFLLFPSPFPRRLFNLAVSVQEDFHTLVHRMSLDRDFLYSSLQYIIDTDSFTRRLWDLYEEVYTKKSNEARRPRLYMGTTRNDYMLHRPRTSPSDSTADLGIKQVEYNMIAVSFGPLEAIVGRWHKFLLGRLLGHDTSPLKSNSSNDDDENNQPNEPGKELGRVVVSAVKAYNEMFSTHGTYVLVVADSPSRNVFDQRWVELAMLEADPTVKTIRRTMAQLRTSIDRDEVEKTGRLVVEGHEIAAVYYRTGYNEGDYDFKAGDWDLVRRPIELSRAAKAPCVAHQLANYKKIQQIIAMPGKLERFGVTGDNAARMRQTFIELLSLNFDDAGEKAVATGIEHCEDYVLKPMQEGGGHNYFGSDMAEVLRDMRSKPERQNFILMGRIRPPTYENVSVAPGENENGPSFGHFSTELGIYGGFIVADGKTVLNQPLGYLLRSKRDGVNESGVAAGFGRIDSAYFID